MPRVLLIRPLCEGDDPEFGEPLGIERLAGYLRDHGVRAELLDRRLYAAERRAGVVTREAAGFWEDVRALCPPGSEPELVGFSLMTEGDVFDAEYKGGERNVFDLQKPFLQALLENTIEVNKDVNAVLKTVNARGLMTWWTADGYPAYVEGKDCDGEYKVGDCAVLFITGKQTNGYVYATVSGPCAEPVDEEESRKYCVEGLLYADDYVPAPAPQGSALDGACVKGLARFLYRYQRSLGQAAERFRVLCVCRILSVLAGDSEAADYIAVSCDYLRSLMLFSMGQIEKIKPLEA